MIMLQEITATPQHIVTIARSNSTMIRKNFIKRKKNDRKIKKSVIILGDSIVTMSVVGRYRVVYRSTKYL